MDYKFVARLKFKFFCIKVNLKKKKKTNLIVNRIIFDNKFYNNILVCVLLKGFGHDLR